MTDLRPYFTQIIGHNSVNVHRIPTKVGTEIRLNEPFNRVFILQIALDEIASVRSRSICEPRLYYESELAPICKKT